MFYSGDYLGYIPTIEETEKDEFRRVSITDIIAYDKGRTIKKHPTDGNTYITAPEVYSYYSQLIQLIDEYEKMKVEHLKKYPHETLEIKIIEQGIQPAPESYKKAIKQLQYLS